MEKKVVLTRDDCYKELLPFYRTVALRAGLPVTENSRFDCRCINVTQSALGILTDYYLTEKNFNQGTLNVLLLWYGPKVCVPSRLRKGQAYFAVITDGFLVEDKEETV